MFYATFFMMVVMNTIALERLMRMFFDKRRTSLVLTVFSYLLFIIPPSVAYLLNTPLFIFLASILAIGVITLNYKSSIAKRCVATVFIFTFFLLLEILALLLLDSLQLIRLVAAEHIEHLAYVTMGLTTLLLALLLQRFADLRKEHRAGALYWISSMSIPTISLFLLFYLLTSLYFTQTATIVFVATLAAINLVYVYFQDTIFKSHEDKLKSALHEQEKDYYFSQLQLMQQSAEQIKTIRHDMKMHLATAMDYNANNRTDELADYLKGLLGDIGKGEVYSDTGNIAVDSIINFKLKAAVENNIQLDSKVLVPPVLNIEAADVVTILGNLLDNALDAVSKVEDKRIKLNVKATKGNLFIAIENTFDGKIKYANGKDGIEKVIVTRKDNSKHGYGLKNIRKSVEKYNGHMDINHEGNIFTVGILLYVDDL